MSSKRRYEGEILIDYRESPGSNPLLAHALGLPHVPAGTKYESATFGCPHCQSQVFINPKRTRERGYCRKCDRNLCDRCTTIMARTRECVPFKRVLDEAQEAAFRAESGYSPIILTR